MTTRRKPTQTSFLEDTPASTPTTLSRVRLELVREERTQYPGPEKFTIPAEVAKFLNGQIGNRPQEHMAALYLDTRHQAVGWTIAHIGTLNRAAVEPRTLLQTGLLLNAFGLILAHNHPSGDPTPSADDLAFTRRLAEAGNLIGIRLVDHLILGSAGRWTSLKTRGAF